MKPVCLVTGAGGRLGKALCRELSAEYNIIASYRRTEPAVPSQNRWPAGEGVAQKVSERENARIYCVQADLNRREDVRRLVEVSLARFGHVDAIVNLAADVKFHGKLIELWHDDEYAPTQLQTNCIAPLQLVSAIHQHCWKDQSRQNAARNRSVVNVSCLSGLYVYNETGQAFYAASKAALNMLTMYLSLELAPYSVRANALCPDRFSDQASACRVAREVQKLLTGVATGAVLT
jgi:NAD(P)-dependent dehydrogenase (short-subunit alcohol dehydrogenase family)